MKNRALFLPIVLFMVLFLISGGLLCAQEDIQKHKNCPYCGMSREQFAHTRILVTYDDGTEVGLCSLHCAAVELSLKLDKTPRSVQVGDYNTKKLIDVEQASWVIGGSKPGVMSRNGKWAFATKEDAAAFMGGNGGTVASFDQAMKAAYEDMYADTKMIRDRRKAKKMQMEHKH
jgi:nitrous oxide reductase accessory protein NosL